MGIFNDSDDSGGVESGRAGDTLPHQMMAEKISMEVAKTNKWIQRVNGEGWNLRKLPDDPSLGQLKDLDKELKRLYDKISEERPCSKEERAKVLHTRQALLELMEVYRVYDSISRPTEKPQIKHSDSDPKDGGTANV